MNLTWIHTSPICNPPLSSLSSAAFSHGLLGPGASFGVILFLQHGAQSFAYSAPTTPVPDATVSPVVCDGPKNLPEEGPRCYSLPVSLASTPLTSEWSNTTSSSCLPIVARGKTTRMDEKQALHFCWCPILPIPAIGLSSLLWFLFYVRVFWFYFLTCVYLCWGDRNPLWLK